MTSCEPGDVVEVPFPFVELPVRKRRPALVLSSADLLHEQGIVVLAMITSAKRSAWNSDVAITDLKAAGLRSSSVVRWKIFTLEAHLLLARRGALAPTDHERVSTALRRLFRPFSEGSTAPV